jgi:hypothetical protein
MIYFVITLVGSFSLFLLGSYALTFILVKAHILSSEWRRIFPSYKPAKLELNVETDAMNTLKSIAQLIGNVDHSRGNGSNAANMRGELLNDIRRMALAALEPAATSQATPKHLVAGQ